MSGEYTAFFYGTLMAPEVFYSVCYGHHDPPDVIKSLHTLTPAVLHNFCRHRVKHADYPGVIHEPGQSVRGIYATGLTGANMDKLDQFEGSDYIRVKVKVKLLKQDGDNEVEDEEKESVVYRFIDDEGLERGEWDFEHFRKEKLKYWSRGEWKDDQDLNDRAAVN